MKKGYLSLAAGLLLVCFALPSLVNAASKTEGDDKARQQRYEELYTEYEKAVMPIHDKFIAKNEEFNAIKRLANTTKEDIAKVLEEITVLKGQMRDAKQAFADKLEKEGFNTYRGFHGGQYQGSGNGGCPQGGSPCGAPQQRCPGY